MKNFILTFFCSLVIIAFSKAQSPVLEFDGIDDYVDIGGAVGNGVRTIEMWFKLEEAIDPQLDEFATLAAREISDTNGNTNEFALTFQRTNLENAGSLRFDIDGTFPYKSVYSDNNTWNADQWYHVAAVVDPIDGMMLFIDGLKQASTHPNTSATGNSSRITTIGCWGDSYTRFFNGQIDNVRFSSDALYSSDFVPSCPDLTNQTNDLGLWNFNENSGNVAFDLSPNFNDGILEGPSRVNTEICPDTTLIGTKDLKINNSLKVYPNPSSNVFFFNLEHPNPSGLSITIYNAIGQTILTQKIADSTFEINLRNNVKGIYFYQLTDGRQSMGIGKLIKE